jgi:hypothetical protein
MADLVYLCVDGSAAAGDILNSLKDACAQCQVPLKSSNYRYSKSMNVGMSDYRKKVEALVSANGGNPSSLRLLIIGKSLGGAKMYRFFYQYNAYLKTFGKVAAAFVDAHEPIVPGDDGDKGKWYDYVYFSGGSHNLNWWTDAWGASANQTDDTAKLRVYCIHQRNQWPLGYSMSSAYRNTNLTGKKVKSPPDNGSAKADHWKISWCDKTVGLLSDAIVFLNG